MSNKGSAFSSGGGGNTFEHYVQTAFLTTFVVRGNVPCFPGCEITEIAFQVSSKGYQTDDLFVGVKSVTSNHKLLAQIKHSITFGENDLFKEVMTAFWKDFNNESLFDKSLDRLLIIKKGLNENERNHIKSLLNWAKAKASEVDFIDEVNRIAVKKQCLDTFKKILDEINASPISNNDLWSFLKCLDIIEYDFGNQASVDEVYFLNLLKLSKSVNSSANEKEIWDSIYGYVCKANKDAGNIIDSKIKELPFFSYFDIARLNPLYKSIEKLKSDSSLILAAFKNNIQGIHLDKTILKNSINESINTCPFTIVTGKPGVGKSAIVKDVLLENYSSDAVFVFRADLFNVPHIAGMFTGLGIEGQVVDLLSCVSLISDKIIFIDSLEKLLEGDSENAFKQLYSLINTYPDIKIIATSRSYAVDLIVQKFGLELPKVRKVEVPTLGKEDVEKLISQIPQLKSVAKNKNIVNILSSPKYLDLIVKSLNKTSEDYSTITVTELKKKLWNNVIEDITTVKNGLSIKRGKTFSDIAIKRAKSMKLFVTPSDDIDEAAIEALSKDDVIFRDGDEYRFAPSHDILEDWALIRYIENIHNNVDKPEDLFSEIGTEPAIRRAFRLWVEDYLVDDKDAILKLVEFSINNHTLEKYWTDELLIAIFKSENCHNFFEVFQKQLLANNAEFLNRCLLLIRTACKENDINYSSNHNLLIPIGSGWEEAIKFIDKHISNLNNLRLSILNILSDWEYLIIFIGYENVELKQKVKQILLYYITQIHNDDSFWKNDVVTKRIDDIVGLLFNIADVSQKEIIDLLNRSLDKGNKEEVRNRGSLYGCILKRALSGAYSGKLSKEIPNEVINAMWKTWKQELVASTRSDHRYSSPFDEQYAWGISDYLDFFPSGIYKTPVYRLLRWHTLPTVKFVLEFINYSIDTYSKSEYKRKVFSYIDITLNDGTIIRQLGSWELWAAYRGLSVTHYLIECILMSLEKYLLELAELKTEFSKRQLKFIFNYLLRNTNSVAITSVLNSVAIAYPDQLEEEFLPLLTVKEFYEWDFDRGMQESQTLSPFDDQISFAQEERWQSNKLSHRTKYEYGLYSFIIDFQFQKTVLNTKIYEIFENLRKQFGDSNDILWSKKLNEMDVRKWEAEYDEERKAFLLQPKYEGRVKEFVESNQEEKIIKNTSASYAVWLSGIYSKLPLVDSEFDKWEECYNYYIGLVSFDFFLDRPKTLAVVGLRNFDGKLNKTQRDWCIEQIYSALVNIIRNPHNLDYELSLSINPIEKEMVLKSIHLLIKYNNENDGESKFIELVIYLLITPFFDHQRKEISIYIRDVLFKIYPKVAIKVWSILILYAKYRQSIPLRNRFGDEQARKESFEKEYQFIRALMAQDNYVIPIDDLSFESYDSDILTRVFLIMPYCDNVSYRQYIVKFITLLIADLQLKRDYSYNLRREGRQLNYHDLHDSKKYLAELLLNSSHDVNQAVIDTLFSVTNIFSKLNLDQIKEIKEFIEGVFEYSIYKLEEYIDNKRDQYEKNIECFWSVWEYLFDKENNSSEKCFSNVLLLYTSISWNEKKIHWLPLDSKKDFYYKIVISVGDKHIKAILNVLSTVGGKCFLPDGITWIVDILKKNPDAKLYLVNSDGERLIKRAYNNHMKDIKSRSKILNDYITILSNMIDLGSSQAYLIRENVITYRVANIKS